MSCESNDDELKLTKEYKYLLSYIRPLIDQLDKSRDAQLCLLWLSKLEQCASWERKYRNKILSDLCEQVKANYLRPPFNSSPPSGSLCNVIFRDKKKGDWSDQEYSDADGSSDEVVSTSTLHSFNSVKKFTKRQTSPLQWKGGHFCNTNKSKNKGLTKPGRDMGDHSECIAVQKAYQERAHSDQIVIERYQDIIKSLVSQQLKADICPNKYKKLQAAYETKLTDLVLSLKKIQEENDVLKQKIDSFNNECSRIENLESENDNLKKQIVELESAKNFLETKIKEAEEEKLITLADVMEKLNESEKKLKESEKRFKSLERKFEESYHQHKTERQNEIRENEKKIVAEISALKSQIEEKEKEIIKLKDQLNKQSNNFEQEICKLKLVHEENQHLTKDKKKIKFLKNKTKKLEKLKEHMAFLFQSQLQQILAKKDFYISTLEMQLKMNNSEIRGSNVDTNMESVLNDKVSKLEAQYRKLLEDSEQQSLRRRQLDLQKIHTLEKQLLLIGGGIEETEFTENSLKTCLITSVPALEGENTVH